MHPELFYKKLFLKFYVLDDDISDLLKFVIYLLCIPISLPYQKHLAFCNYLKWKLVIIRLNSTHAFSTILQNEFPETLNCDQE